jgi:hypothetical protein
VPRCRGWERQAAKPAAALCLALLVCLAGGVPARAARRATGPPTVYTFPMQGSQVAPPTTQIAFRGIPAARLGQISVVGSVSGVHTGTVEADSDGDGGSFIPATPFSPGEIVTVGTSLNISGGTNGTFEFRVATPAGPIPPAIRPAAPRVNGDVWAYRSNPDLLPAAVTILKHGPTAPGDIFLAPQIGPFQQGPEIIGPNGGLIWFDPVPTNDAATDFRVQTYHGQPVLTWWQGNESAGVGVGQDMIVNRSYQLVKAISAGNGLSADLHEFQLTPRGTALVTAEYPVYWNASSVGAAANEIVLDSVVQEIDIPTGLVLFQWDSLDHVPLTASWTKPPKKQYGAGTPYDYFHVNSITLDTDGNLLISGRNTWSVYKVNHDTGAIIWTLGGKESSFEMGPGASFAFQHDVEVRAPGDQVLTVFDDGAGPPYVHSQSRVLELRLNLKLKTATVVRQLVHTPPLLSSFEGDDQPLPNGDDFVGWGQQPYFSEYNPKGKLVFDGRFVDSNLSYRAYRFPWNGTPASPPSVAAAPHGRKMTVYVSWNGATNVASWRVLGGKAATRLGAIAQAPKRGFETAINATAHKYVAVQALDVKGHVLGTSSVSQVP